MWIWGSGGGVVKGGGGEAVRGVGDISGDDEACAFAFLEGGITHK